MTADEEDNYNIAQANEPLDDGMAASSSTRSHVRRYQDKIPEVDRTKSTTWTFLPSSWFPSPRPDPVPRERRRQPRPDGFEHAASGRAADQDRIADHRHRHGARRQDSGVCIRVAKNDGVVEYVSANKIVIDKTRRQPL
jgi:DNA-directed RNA polymerase subunit beta